MVKVLKNQKGAYYVIMSKEELREFSLVSNSKCDECFKELTNKEKIVYIPSLNEAYCKECGIEKLKWCSSCENELDERYVENRMKQINEVFNVIDEEKDLLELIKEDKQRIENRANINRGYDLLNKLYNVVPESYKDKISYDNNTETIFFDDIALGTIDDIKDIGCWNGKICGREDNETTEFDKFINIDKIGSYRNIFFTYKDNGEYECEIIEELEKGKIYGRNENMQVVEVME
ncbi:hypothetical protein FDA33_01005 [Clostridium botulinum]|uniref:hypothetical protein n=1 Tax=Clostridium botulinum TaxID=1491 RepID=UPI0013CC73BC|nr:hypothetical protein [Clostridium botulinum]MBN1061293.1 hypothetical protein [Clostridium botulinum]NFH88809.1 hypothetical protein [Clostridium botulinum]NFI16763.1 hypothetical protein [Clostridium botulinum]NFL94292.1 hypothetical protein [Clostridium botulinum]NFN50315.1 hypothetical protein [Clostridium botulinum]